MDKPTVDPKRTGVKATQQDEWPDDCNYQPGAFYRLKNSTGRLQFACPGCGQLGSIRAGNPKPAETPSWDIVSGTVDDVTTLTLSPSINCVGCCGWHGYLKNGVFESC